MVDFPLVAARMLAQAEALLPKWLPGGRWVGREWECGSLQGGTGKSCKANRDTGRWADFAVDAKGGDLISLYAAIHGLTQLDAAKELAHDDVQIVNGHNYAARAVTIEEPPVSLSLPPREAPLEPRAFAHPRHGVPSVRYVYRSPAGEPLYVVARYQTNDGKEFAPWTWDEEFGRWKAKAAPKPRALYGLQRLESHPRRVVVVEGEKSADALQGIVTKSPVITWAGGANSWKTADWKPLKGRQVLLWPDADPPGVSAMQGILAILLRQGCPVWRVDVDGLPDGYDAADCIQAGAIDPPALKGFLDPRVRAVVRQDDTPEPQRVLEPGPILGRELIEHVPEPPPDDTPPITEETPRAYQMDLHRGRHGVHINLANTVRVVASFVEAGVIAAIWLDTFMTQIRTPSGEWSDTDTLSLQKRIQEAGLGLHKISRSQVDDAVNLYASTHERSSVREWLTGLTWDGTPRLRDLLPLGFGTHRGAYTEAVGRCFLMGMVARGLMPGCKVDNLPVFEGAQGIKKSQALATIGGVWHAEVTDPVTSKDFYLALAGKLLIEIPEFKSFHGIDAEAQKAAITRTFDRFRAPYEKRPADHPRACVFAATINRREWINDPTGGRRFWPVACGEIDTQWIEEHRDALFAEAVARVQAVPASAGAAQRVAEGAAWWDVPEDLARLHQDERQRSDAISGPMYRWCLSHNDFTTLDVATFALALEGPPRLDERLHARIKDQLTRWGFVSRRTDQGETAWSRVAPVARPAGEPLQ